MTSGRPKKKPRTTQRTTKTNLSSITPLGKHDSQHPEVDVPGGWRKVQCQKRKRENPKSPDRGEHTGKTKKSDRDDGKKKRRAPAKKKKMSNKRHDPDSSSSGQASSSSSDDSSSEDFDD
jgi:hypothetical protein